MAEKTPIQWCDGTVNPVVGCDGCELWQAETGKSPRRSCYAGYLHNDRFKGRNRGFAERFEIPTRRPGQMAKAANTPDLRGRRRGENKGWLDGLPRLWFVSDMGDAFSKLSSRPGDPAEVDFPYLRAEIIDVVRTPGGRRHQWLWLTKQPKRMVEFSRWLLEKHVAWPKHLWAGTSITEGRYVERVDYLREVGDDDTVRFLSVEPQHALISLAGKLGGISLVIQGGESGPTKVSPKVTLDILDQRGAREFDIAWARALRDECRRAKVPYFLKQLGSAPVEDGRPVKLDDSHGGDWDEWPKDLRVREMPKM